MADGGGDFSWLNPFNWFGSSSSGTSGAPQMTGFASSMSPGQSGVGGFTAPTADDPRTSASQTGNVGSTGSGTDWSKVAQSLKDVQKGLSGGQGDSTGGKQQSAQLTQAPLGQPHSSLDALLQGLQARQRMYEQSAMQGPAGQRQQSSGLLGY